MMKARSLKAILAASVCLLPFQALAEGNDDFDVAEKPASAAQAEAPKNWIIFFSASGDVSALSLSVASHCCVAASTTSPSLTGTP